MCVYVREYDSFELLHFIELKFDMYITGHRWTNPIDFDECRMYRFSYWSTKKNSYALRSMELNSLKGSNIQTVSFEFIFGIHSVGHYWKIPMDFGECPCVIFYRSSKKFLIHHDLWSQIL